MQLLHKIKQKLKSLSFSQNIEVELYHKDGWSKLTLEVTYDMYVNQHGFKGKDFSVAFDNVKMSHIEKLLAILEAAPTSVIEGVFLPSHQPLELDLSGHDGDT